MGVDLCSDSGVEFQFNNRGWRHLQVFASAHGYELPDDADSVTAEEASRFADAIERGMNGGSSAEIAARVSKELTELLVVSGSPMFPDDPISFTEKSVDYWRQFIAFARSGAFSIYY